MTRRLSFPLIAVLLGATLGAGQQPPSPAKTAPLVITHANVIDGVSAQPLRDATVIVRDARVDSVTAGPANPPAGATVLDLKGRWLLPGFVDAHTHIGDLQAARRALHSGATTVRILGVPHFADLGLRELNREGVADLPGVVAAGYQIRPDLMETFFLDYPKLKDWMGGISGAENMRRMVRLLAERRVDVVKILATERAGTADTDPRKRTFTDEEMAAIVDEARKSGLPVAAHAHGDEGARAAVRAGVRSIEHGTFLSDETLALMKERGTYLVPTIATVIDLIDPGGDYDDPMLSIRGRAMLPRVRDTAARAWKVGVKIVAGTDTGYGPKSNRRVPHEVIELVNIGMPPMEAIKAATSVAAECLGVANRTGSIVRGKDADLVVVDRDPLADISALQDVLVVVHGGKVVLNRIYQ